MISTVKSLIKIALRPRRATIKPSQQTLPIIILGNGPSLNQTLDCHRASLEHHPLLAVNFFANSPEFNRLKPSRYVLTDPHFFENQSDPNVSRLQQSLNAITWQMTLFLPFGAKFTTNNPLLTIERYPLTGVEGSAALERVAYDLRVGTPRPRNVLIPSIMIAIWCGFTEIYIVGADHTWPRSLAVNERNETLNIQTHFYKEDEHELQRITNLNTRIDYLMESWCIAFRSYHRIRRYANSQGIKIYNASAESFIDAFDRRQLPL